MIYEAGQRSFVASTLERLGAQVVSYDGLVAAVLAAAIGETRPAA